MLEHAESVSLHQGTDKKQGFKKLKLLDPRYVLPGRKHFSHTALPKLYAECMEKVEEETYFATTTDLWSIVLIIVIEWKYKYL